jgi:hypothetical protein
MSFQAITKEGRPMVSRAITACILAFCAYGCTSAVEGGATEGNEPTGSVAEAINPTSCATASRDVVLNSTVSQVGPFDTPATYDNPGCNEGYIVQYDGTVNGVHYGYRLETPRTGSTDGIEVLFSLPPLKQLHSCDGALRGGGYLYERQSNGTWGLVTTIFVDSTTTSNFGITHCAMTPVLFNQVVKGSASTPHIYKVALTLDVLDPSQFAGDYPDGQGYGPLALIGCDVNHPCP